VSNMSDVARAAGVSVSTVSHVINGTRPVDPATEQAVQQAIRNIGYIPNTLARSLARSATNTIGVAISTFANHYFTDIVRSIDVACERAGLTMLLADTHDDPAQELRVVQSFHQRRVDGILLAPSNDGHMPSLSYLRRSQIPAVLVDHLQDAPFDQVGTDNAAATDKLVSHLIAHGHRRIGFISGAVSNSTSGERLVGYRQALHTAGLPFDEALVACGESSIEPARQATHRLLAVTPKPPTAIVSGNNLMTLGALRAFNEGRIAIPGQIAFAAFDDFDWADLFTPSLTVISQPLESIGAEAARRLILRIGGSDAPPETHRLPSSLKIRASCGCAVAGAAGKHANLAVPGATS